MSGEMLSTQSYHMFTQARRREVMRSLLRFLGRQTPDLLPFDPVQHELRLRNTRDLGIQDVPLDDIVGSVGRYRDFDREFLPRSNSQALRWRRIFDLSTSFSGFPPIELFKVGAVYFVRDGNHRVSVAWANKARTIEAHVIEYLTPIKLKPSDDLDAILIKADALDFFEVTQLHQLRPDQNIQFTRPGRYHLLLEHIAVHKYLREVSEGRELSYDEAVVSWYDQVYTPIVAEIRRRALLEHFPQRTETDLYAWVLHHRAELESMYGLGKVDNALVLETLPDQSGLDEVV